MSKRFSLLFVVTLSVFLTTSTAFSQTKATSITAYSDDFSGNHYEFGPGQYDNLYLIQTGYQIINSFKVPKGMRVRLFAQDNYKGEPLVLTEDAHTDFLRARGYTDSRLNISMIVDSAPEPDPATANQVVIIYKDNFTGSSQTLSPGEYEPSDLNIGNDQLTSLRIPKGMKVTLYENHAFEGKSLELIKDTSAEVLLSKGFNDITSSIRVEIIPPATPTPTPAPVVVPVVVVPVVVPVVPEPTGPSVTFYVGGFDGDPMRLGIGAYQLQQDMHLKPGQPFAFRVPYGMRVTLHDEASYARRPGKKIILTEDTGYSVIAQNGFQNINAWVVVDEAPAPELQATLFRENFSGPSANLSTGKYNYSDLGVGNDALSSIRIPRGLRVTLYEHANFEGRSAMMRSDADTEFFMGNQFNDLTSSVVVEKIPAEDLQVTIYRENFSGTSKTFLPGRYDAFTLRDEEDKLSSVRVPQGMKITLFENDNFTGRSLVLTRDAGGDFILSNRFNDITSSLTVEDYFVPVVTPKVPEPVVVPVPTPTPIPVIVPVVVEPLPAPVVDCKMSDKKFEDAVKAINVQAFSDGKLNTASLSTRNKCLTVYQVREIGKALGWDETKISFLKSAYELCANQDEYYTLLDIFTFGGSKDEFTAWLKNK